MMIEHKAKDLPRHRLIVMSVGSLVGTALLECLELLGRDRFEIIGLNSEPDAINNFRCDVCYLSPQAQDRVSLLQLLTQVADRHRPDLVIPSRDDDVVAAAHWHRANPEVPVMVGSTDVAEIIRDKWLSYCWARDNGLPFARSAIDASGAANLLAETGFPLVAKPRLGFGSNGVRFLLDEKHISAALRAGHYVLQEAVDPAPALSLATLEEGLPLWFAPVQPGSPLGLCLLDSQGAHFIATWHSNHRHGTAIDTILIDVPSLKSTLMAFAQVAWRDGWRGLFNIQARRDKEGRYVPIELAARFMGGTNALQTLGVPVVESVLLSYLPSYKGQQVRSPKFDARAVKQPRTHLVHRSYEELLLNTGVWSKS